MAVMNNLVQQPAPPQQYMVQYKAGNTDIVLDEQTVVNYLVNGDSKNVTPQEVIMFMKLCEHQGLNPWLREAYLVKYGNQQASIVTGKTAFEKRAARCDKYRGFEAGIIVVRQDGSIENRTGTFYLPEERLVGGWARVYVDGYAKPVETAVSMQEYIGRKRDGSVNGQWNAKPATMIRKVAKAQALREAFPEDFHDTYIAEEVGAYDLPEMPIEPPHVGQQTIVETEIAPPPQEQYEYDEFAEIMGA